MKLTTFELYAKEVKTENNKFMSCSAILKDKYTRVKFTRKCGCPVYESGYYNITVDLSKCSVSHDNYVNKDGVKGSTPVLWISEIEKCVPVDEEELAKRQALKLEELFD